MFRKTIPSMSFPAFLDVLVSERKIFVCSWVETTKEMYDGFLIEFDENQTPMDRGVTRSLSFNDFIQPHEFPPEASGVYYRNFPCARLSGPVVLGEDLKPELEGRYFEARGYSYLDLDDPSINSAEKTDAAVWTIGIDYDGFPHPCFNSVSLSADTKMHPLRAARNLGAPSCLFVYQPFKDTPFTECSISLKYNMGIGYYSNLTGWTENVGFNYLGHMADALPTIRLTSGSTNKTITADGTETVEFKIVDINGTTIDQDTTVYLESTGGYLPKSRIDVVNGIGSFKTTAMGLTSGDTYKVKLGFRTMSGLLDVNFEVS